MKPHKELRDIFEKYINGKLNTQQTREFLEYIQNKFDRNVVERLIKDRFESEMEPNEIRRDLFQPILDQTWKDLQKTINQRNKIRFFAWQRIVGITASILFVLATGMWFYQNKANERASKEKSKNIILPGQQTATLTLADGRKIRLADSNEGELAKDGAVIISKAADRQLLYEIKEGENSSKGFHTLTTSRGETYSVKLPDGTQVWLNAASSIRYPSSFNTQSKREVKLEGEAYFEVARDPNKPFVVYTDRQEINVLGTRFNVNSYSNELNLRTTLLEGSIKIKYQNKQAILYPGQQSSLSPGGLQVNQIDTEPIISWTHHEFMFDGEDIESVMRKLERWYNVTVVYKGTKTKEKFGGGVSRFENVEQVLQLLEKTGGIHFKVEGKTVFVFPD